jgi:hypothetical protein
MAPEAFVSLSTYLEELNDRYLELHQTKERAFWDTRMGLVDRHRELAEADLALKEFLADSTRLATLRKLRAEGAPDAKQAVVLDGWILTFSRNQVESAEARSILREIIDRETDLQQARGGMDLGFHDACGEFVRASSVALGNAVRTNSDEAVRRASFEGLRSIETFALDHGFAELVRLRNRFARAIGFEDFYEYKVQWAEGFDKQTLFRFLDDLERRTRDKAAHEVEGLRARHGDDVLHPWNFAYNTWGGDIQRERDPYFRFEDALGRWARTFAALGIRFRNAKITLDLVDRKGKYENGFMHGPVPAFYRKGEWVPAEINFTANALPGRVGAGFRAAQTLFHEGGHAAHFANIAMDAPCFSQEHAPTSVALAETQSMFCDSFLDDPEWQTRYARDARGSSIPWELIRRGIELTHPFSAQNIRNMLVVCYSEKALYEMKDDELTPENVLRAFRSVEERLTLLPGGCPRPTLSVPHLLSWEASAYYHGYVLAQMAVAQTRQYFREKYGYLLDNPAIGEDLAAKYWAPGNSRGFLDFVADMTGKPFAADALVAEVSRPNDVAVREAHEAIERSKSIPEFDGDLDLDVRLSVIHGAETVVGEGASPLDVAERFREWIEDLRAPEETAETR